MSVNQLNSAYDRRSHKFSKFYSTVFKAADQPRAGDNPLISKWWSNSLMLLDYIPVFCCCCCFSVVVVVVRYYMQTDHQITGINEDNHNSITTTKQSKTKPWTYSIGDNIYKYLYICVSQDSFHKVFINSQSKTTHAALTRVIMIWSSHNFAHVTTAELSCHVQTCDLFGSSIIFTARIIITRLYFLTPSLCEMGIVWAKWDFQPTLTSHGSTSKTSPRMPW